MAAIATKNDCDFNEFVRIISGLNVESIASINFAPKITIFSTLAMDCMIKEYEVDFLLPREELNGDDLRFRIIKLYHELDQLIANEVYHYCLTAYSYNLTMASYKEKKARLALNIDEDPEYMNALQKEINKIHTTKRGRDLWKKTPVNKRPTLVENVKKKTRKEWEKRRKEQELNLLKQKEGIRKLLKNKLKMEKQLRKDIINHMKEIGGIKDYSEKRAQSIINHYYEMSYPDGRNVGRAGMLTQIKITIPAWLRMLERLIVHIKEMDERREKLKAKRNADELIAEETAEEIDREMAKILREKEQEEKVKEKEMREELKKLKAKQKNISAKKIQRAFRHTRKKPTRMSIPSAPSNESKQPSLQPIDDVDRAIIERIKELYGYLMEKKIFKTYREKRERILTVMIPYHRHLLQFMKERLIPQLEDKKIRVVVTGGFATALLTGNYKTEDVDMKLYLIRETEENNANFKMRDIVKAILEENLDFLNEKEEELSYRIYEPSRNPLENNGDIPVKITGRINEEKEGKRENPRVPGDYDAVGELTFSATEYNGNLIDVEGIPVLSPEILIDNLLNRASNNFRQRMESRERNIYPEKLLGWMKQLQALLRLKNPDAANELSKEIDRMKTPSPKQGGKRKKKRTTRKKRRKKKKTKRKRKKNRKKRTRRK
tara:strand:+ start:708 stop:2696 length:1989 start_codon:yes stop_codon:yes gene_type:complete